MIFIQTTKLMGLFYFIKRKFNHQRVTLYQESLLCSFGFGNGFSNKFRRIRLYTERRQTIKKKYKAS